VLGAVVLHFQGRGLQGAAQNRFDVASRNAHDLADSDEGLDTSASGSRWRLR
jgi:hypothetical protein